MCGISGFASPALLDAGVLLAMNNLARHRGPDDEGYVLFDVPRGAKPDVLTGADTPRNVDMAGMFARIDDGRQRGARVALGHRRLAVIEPGAAAHQPMSSRDGRFWLSYNGEIYNFRELGAQLVREGVALRTASDTEVLLEGFAHRGLRFFDDCVGMWAVAIFDRLTGQLLLCRDRFGIKPLYYRVGTQGEVGFASEIKQLAGLPDWHPRVDGGIAYDFLVHAISDHTERTFFADVRQVPPGHVVRIDCTRLAASATTLAAQRWYELEATPFDGGLADAAAGFRERFLEAVSLHLRSDVPIGFCLSGGLDSSAIVCAARRISPQADLRTFTAGSAIPRFDEQRWSRLVVEATGARSCVVEPDADALFRDAARLCRAQDEPFGSTSIFAQSQVFAAAGESGIKVMLDGQGADEQLAGYHSFFAARLAGEFRSLHWVGMFLELRAMARLHGLGTVDAAKLLAAATLPEQAITVLSRAAGFSTPAPEWLAPARIGTAARAPMCPPPARGASVAALSRAQLCGSNLQMLLHWEDRNSMAASVESRVPFLDHRLVEYVLGLPDALKLHRGETKRVMRVGLEGILPEPVRTRRDKVGFVTAEETWMRHSHNAAFRERLQRAVRCSDGILRENAALGLFDSITRGERRFSFIPWRMISLGEWMEEFRVSA